MISKHKISFITTVLNEETSIEQFLDSLVNQSLMPDEIIIVDGGSSDSTRAKIKSYELKIKRKKVKFIFLIKEGNRSVGRNEAIKQAKGEIIACSDAGCILDKNWIKNISEPFLQMDTDVVAGYYKGFASNVFQKCVIPYALVMPDKVNPNNFLPATRSVAFSKDIWKKAGKFDEKLSHNEDYPFARQLKKINAKIIFKKEAIVYWKPRNSFKEAFIMIYRFAYGDAEARILRPKVVMVFLRYILVALLLLFVIYFNSFFLFGLFLFFLLLYFAWACSKNYKYVKQWQALYILPLLQLIADWAVLKGTILAFFKIRIRYN